ncbi:MAG TPA: FtsK/SpoIIIE domain-containing protein [Blastocatellia bacterium]|nr:FtsK/SpoIIIE domain-containing protein [Blastocatellia bacterium]
MAVTLRVSDVRAAIWQSAGAWESAGAGAPSNMLLGRMFHEIFAELVGPDERRNFRAVLETLEPDLCRWKKELIAHTWQRLAGPRLRQQQAHLHQATEQVLDFWDAVQELCNWLAGLLWQAAEGGLQPAEMRRLIAAEQPLEWEVRDDNWTDAVRLIGVADSICRLPAGDHWCVIELKTGRTAPEADLAQACLYHQMLAADGRATGSLALVSFTPQREECLFEGPELHGAQQRLKELIGRLAGVLPEERAEVITPKPSSNGHRELGERLVQAFEQYGVGIRVAGEVIVSPAFLRFPIELGRRVTLKAVRSRIEDAQARLGLETPPRLSLEGGRVAIDLQRPPEEREVIRFSQIRRQLPARDEMFGCSQIPVGVDISGRLRMMDFAHPESPHLLVAGTTGSGKSEWLRSAIAGLLLTNTPATMRLILVDPKMLAFQLLQNSPFLQTPIVYLQEQPVIEVLKCLVTEMEARYQQMKDVGADTLTDYIRRTGQPVPRLFFICDEYADLMMGERAERKELEHQIRRLGQKARAAGIHLILTTQRPSVDIVTGAIRTNLPARIALKLGSIESRMLLGENGAESLLGRGDLLFKCIGDPVRLQSPYLPAEELAEIFGAADAELGASAS